MKEEGHPVDVLDDEPLISVYEGQIIKASGMCNSISDIYYIAKSYGFIDIPEFIDLVSACKEHIEKKGK
jgi:hypothetical protein